jgi:alpha-tubulin suppressor-like RCC1 family protein
VWAEQGPPLDVVDVAVGEGHVALVSKGGDVFVVGDNKNGQLGIGSNEDFVEEWMKLPNMKGAKGVVCGPKSTFLLTTPSGQQQTPTSTQDSR